MKRPPVNLYQVQLTSWLARQAFLRKFRRYWGTTIVNGVEVLSPKVAVHPGLSSRTRQLLKMLQLLDQITSQRYKGVRSAWLYLNSSKASSVPVDVQRIRKDVDKYINELLTKASKYNTLAPKDYLHTFTIKILANNESNGFQPRRLPRVTPETVVDILRTHRIQFSNLFAFIQFLLTPVAFTSTRRGRVAETLKPEYLTDRPETVYRPVIVCTYQLPSKAFNSTDISSKLKRFLDVDIKGRRSVHRVSNYDLNLLNMERAASSTTVHQANTRIWHAESPHFRDNPPTYLRASFLSDTAHSLDTRIETVMKTLDFGYAQKGSSFFSKLVVLVVVITAAVLAMPTGGMSLVALATVTVAISIAITVTALLMYTLGDYGGANFAKATSAAISPFVQIAQFVLLIKTGVDLAKASKAAMTTAGEQTTKNAVERAIDKLLARIDAKFVVDTLDYTVGLWNKNRVQEARRKNEKLEQEVAEFEEASKQNDLAQQFMDTYTKPLRTDWSVYAERYARPYEPTNPKFHIGNIQATTVTAFNYIS